MSYEEKTNQNRFRISREVTIGDIVTVGVCALAIAKLYFTVGDHEKRLSTTETTVQQHQTAIAHHDTQIAVIEAQMLRK